MHGLLTAAGRKLVESSEPDEGALVAELNALVGGPSVYDADAFAQVELSKETREAAEAGAAGELLARLNRTLLDAAYPDQLATPAEKRVLRFAGNRAETRELAIRLPAGVTVVEAALETIESIGADRPAGDGATVGQPSTNSGVRVELETTVAAKTELETTLAATGLGLLLVPTTEKAELLAELREDHSGAPKGRKLAEATFVGRRARRPHVGDRPVRVADCTPGAGALGGSRRSVGELPSGSASRPPAKSRCSSDRVRRHATRFAASLRSTGSSRVPQR